MIFITFTITLKYQSAYPAKKPLREGKIKKIKKREKEKEYRHKEGM